MALQTHLVGIGRELEGFLIRGCVVGMRIVARDAGGASFAEAARPFEGFANKSRCPKAAVGIKPSVVVIRKQVDAVSPIKGAACLQIIPRPASFWLVSQRLHVALPANG